MAVVLDPWATYPRQTETINRSIDIQTMLEIMGGGFRYLKGDVTVTAPVSPATYATATLGDHAVQRLALGYAQTMVSLPPNIPEGRIGDLVVFVENNYAPEVEGTPTPAEASVIFDAGRGTTYEIATVDGDKIDDVLTFDASAKGVLYLTLSPLTVVDSTVEPAVTKPVWVVTRHDVSIAEVSNEE